MQEQPGRKTEFAMVDNPQRTKKNGFQKRRRAGRPATIEVAGRVEDLLDTATAVFLEHGYDHAIMGEIAKRADASKATIYSRYPTKADLFVAVLNREELKLQLTYAETLVGGMPLKEVLEEYGIRLMRGTFNPEFCSLYRVLAAASSKFPSLASKFWEAGPQKSVAMLRDYLAVHPEFKGKHPAFAAEMFWSFCCGQPVLRALVQKEDVLSERELRIKAKEATRILLAAYASSWPS